jgi:hypothetical protein
MPLMCTLGFGPEMIDFRTVLAAAFLLGLTLVLSLAAEIWARGRRASNAKALLPLVESPKVADDAMTLMLRTLLTLSNLRTPHLFHRFDDLSRIGVQNGSMQGSHRGRCADVRGGSSDRISSEAVRESWAALITNIATDGALSRALLDPRLPRVGQSRLPAPPGIAPAGASSPLGLSRRIIAGLRVLDLNPIP